jgi:hypothetical protein
VNRREECVAPPGHQHISAIPFADTIVGSNVAAGLQVQEPLHSAKMTARALVRKKHDYPCMQDLIPTMMSMAFDFSRSKIFQKWW